MDLVHLEFNPFKTRQNVNYNTGVVGEEDINIDTDVETTVKLKFDKLDSINLDENLNVCTIETIRGKNKTFNAYLKPIEISIKGEFSSYVSTNMEIKSEYGLDNHLNGIVEIDRLVGKDKFDKLNKWFSSAVESTLLINVVTFYKSYTDYVITNFNLTYSSNSTITVELTLQQILLRELQSYKESLVPYHLTEEVSREEALKLAYFISKISNNSTFFTYEELQEYINTQENT